MCICHWTFLRSWKKVQSLTVISNLKTRRLKLWMFAQTWSENPYARFVFEERVKNAYESSHRNSNAGLVWRISLVPLDLHWYYEFPEAPSFKERKIQIDSIKISPRDCEVRNFLIHILWVDATCDRKRQFESVFLRSFICVGRKSPMKTGLFSKRHKTSF